MARDNYEDIIHLPRPVSKKHPPMPLRDRAAQFMPFAALTGYDAEIRESARLTEEEADLSEDLQTELNEKLAQVRAELQQGRQPQRHLQQQLHRLHRTFPSVRLQVPSPEAESWTQSLQ
jgi:hypothetical protein